MRFFWIITLGVFASLVQAGAQASFLSAQTCPVGSGPFSVVAGDINGDNKVDLICANGFAGTLNVLTNNGSGNFGIKATYTVGTGFGNDTTCVVAADVQGDGQLDLISSNHGDNSLKLLTNDGWGNFSFDMPITVGGNPGNSSESVTAADINGDGKTDLIVSIFGINSVLVLTNNGMGIFSSRETNAAYGPANVTVADLNKDSKPDLIIANEGFYPAYNNTITIFTNRANIAFGSNATYIVGNAPIAIAAADINHDQSVDLICANYNPGNSGSSPGTLTVLTNNGYGVMGSNATYTVGDGPREVIAADLNGDGHIDVASVNDGGSPYYPGTLGTISVLTNNGSGSFSSASTLNVGGCLVSFAEADINANGRLAFICANYYGNSLSVWTNNMTFPSPTSIPTLNLEPAGEAIQVSWPSASPGWSLQQNPDLSESLHWGPSGYGAYPILDDGTNKSLTLPAKSGNLFFRLVHP